jgi:hypothetical protein
MAWFGMKAFRQTEVYQTALAAATGSPEVQAALGTPIEDGLFPQVSIKYNNGSGEADLSIPLTGPTSSGTLVVKASHPPGGAWQYSVFEVRVKDGTTIALHPGAPAVP